MAASVDVGTTGPLGVELKNNLKTGLVEPDGS